jgi:hypothetical protein
MKAWKKSLVALLAAVFIFSSMGSAFAATTTAAKTTKPAVTKSAVTKTAVKKAPTKKNNCEDQLNNS